MSRIQKGGDRLGIRGYTITEVMMFLGVSGLLLIAVMPMVISQQRSTEFNVGVKDYENRVVDLLNDVETGYSGAPDLKCQLNGSSNAIATATPAPKGTSEDCVFLGKGLRFQGASTAGATTMDVYTIAGRRNAAAPGGDLLKPTSLTDANPAIYGGVPPENYTLPQGLELTNIILYRSDGTTTTSQGLLLIGNIGTGYSAGSTAAAVGRVQLVRTNISTFVTDEATFDSDVQNIATSEIFPGAVLCLRHGAGGRQAAIAIGVTLNGSTPVVTSQKSGTETYYDNVASLGC